MIKAYFERMFPELFEGRPTMGIRTPSWVCRRASTFQRL